MQPQYGQPVPAPIDSGMTRAIIAIFLFWPLAIPAIISASKVNDLAARGDLAGAQAAAEDSKKWSKLAFIIGGVLIALSVLGCCGLFSLGAINSNSS
jgi:hypothetical protein